MLPKGLLCALCEQKMGFAMLEVGRYAWLAASHAESADATSRHMCLFEANSSFECAMPHREELLATLLCPCFNKKRSHMDRVTPERRNTQKFHFRGNRRSAPCPETFYLPPHGHPKTLSCRQVVDLERQRNSDVEKKDTKDTKPSTSSVCTLRFSPALRPTSTCLDALNKFLGSQMTIYSQQALFSH